MNHEVQENPDSERKLKKKSGLPGRKKFVRKATCQICGDVANDHNHYGATGEVPINQLIN